MAGGCEATAGQVGSVGSASGAAALIEVAVRDGVGLGGIEVRERRVHGRPGPRERVEARMPPRLDG
jgi:hypothetical protein